MGEKEENSGRATGKRCKYIYIEHIEQTNIEGKYIIWKQNDNIKKIKHKDIIMKQLRSYRHSIKAPGF